MEGVSLDWNTSTTVLDRLTAGDDEAWELFSLVFAEYLRSALRHYRTPRDVLEDRVQDCLVAVLSGLEAGQYQRSRGPFRRWVWGIARNRARTPAPSDRE